MKKDQNILRVQIRSRHTSSKVNNLWIETHAEPYPIIRWFCQCKSGARVVAYYAHIASVLWYICYLRHNHDRAFKTSSSFEVYIKGAPCSSEAGEETEKLHWSAGCWDSDSWDSLYS